MTFPAFPPGLAGIARPSLRLAQVTDGCRLCYTVNASTKYQNIRSPVRFYDDVTALQVAFYTGYVTGGVETGLTGLTTIEASLENPATTMTRFLFSGNNSISAAANTVVFSDLLSVSTIPRGTLGWIRSFWNNSTALPYYYSAASPLGRGFEGSGTVIASKVGAGSGTITGDSAAHCPPCLVLAYTRTGSVAILGDSIDQGSGDTAEDYSNHLGLSERCIGQHAPFTNLASGGETRQQFISTHTNRAIIAAYTSHRWFGWGVNDIAAGRTVAQMLADDATIRGYFTGARFIQRTATPETTSSDSWATVANQTATFGTILNDYNSAIITKQPGIDHTVDVCGVLESAPESRKFTLNYGVPTADGVHPSHAAHLAVQRSGIVRAEMFSRLTP